MIIRRRGGAKCKIFPAGPPTPRWRRHRQWIGNKSTIVNTYYRHERLRDVLQVTETWLTATATMMLLCVAVLSPVHTVAEKWDSLTFLRQCGQGFTSTSTCRPTARDRTMVHIITSKVVCRVVPPSVLHVSPSYCCTQYDRLLAWWCSLSVCLSVCVWQVYCTAHGRCRGWKLYRHVSRRALLFTCSNTFAVGCIVQPQHSEKPNRQNFRAWNSHGSGVTWPWLFQTRHFRRFGSAAIPYVVRSTIGS